MRVSWLHAVGIGAALSLAACGGADASLYVPEAADAGGDASGIATSWGANRGEEQLEQLRAVEASLAAARARWSTSALTDYSVKVRRQCFCAPALRDHVQVTVAHGLVEEARGLTSEGRYETPIPSDEGRAWYTVTGMFDLIEANLNADRVVAEYDERTGFPTFLLLDYHLVSSEEGDIFEMWDLEQVAEP